MQAGFARAGQLSLRLGGNEVFEGPGLEALGGVVQRQDDLVSVGADPHGAIAARGKISQCLRGAATGCDTEENAFAGWVYRAVIDPITIRSDVEMSDLSAADQCPPRAARKGPDCQTPALQAEEPARIRGNDRPREIRRVAVQQDAFLRARHIPSGDIVPSMV